ncbi:MAG: helix-turn-helix transcriptional regulator [Actinomycetales bacterium]
MTATRVDRTERLLNLLICLLAARSPVHRAQIRERIPGYPQGDAAFERMFERDKDELRGMGIPVQTVLDAHGDVLGYRVERSQAQLPEISVTAPERAVLAVAATVWDATVAQSTAALGARKFEAAAADVDTRASSADVEPVSLGADTLVPRLASHDAALIPLLTAVHRARQVAFDYRSAGTAELSRRKVEPWALVSDQGRWYVLGFDVDRVAPRVFRLSRIDGDIELSDREQTQPRPANLDAAQLRAMLAPHDPEGPTTATVRVAAGQAAELRRLAISSDDDLLQIQTLSRERLVSVVCAAGDAVAVQQPMHVRQEVTLALARIVERHAVPQ